MKTFVAGLVKGAFRTIWLNDGRVGDVNSFGRVEVSLSKKFPIDASLLRRLKI